MKLLASSFDLQVFQVPFIGFFLKFSHNDTAMVAVFQPTIGACYKHTVSFLYFFEYVLFIQKLCVYLQLK